MRPGNRSGDPDHVIRASEVGAYLYCAHAWWLGSIEGMRQEDRGRLEAGAGVHERHGRRALAGAALTRVAQLLLALAGLVGLAWAVSTLIG